MQWFQVAYLAALVVLAIKFEDEGRQRSLRAAWKAFAMVPLVWFVMGLFRGGDRLDSRSLAQIDQWTTNFSSLFLFISLLWLTGAIAPWKPPAAETGAS